MPRERSNQFGRASDFSLLESDNGDEFRRQCEASLNTQLTPAVAALVRQARNAGISIVIVEMPMRTAHRRLFYETSWWEQYTSHVRDLLAPYSAIFIDSSGWIPDDSLFADPLHLGPAGAARFSERLGAQLAPLLSNLSTYSPSQGSPLQ